jgi:chitosanase
LRELAAQKSGEVSGLDGFHFAWAKAARDRKFAALQDEVVEQMYYQPALQIAEGLGLKSALGKLVIYDTLIQHGNGDDPDGLRALLGQAKDIVRGTPKEGIGESNWLYTFLKVRRADLKEPHNSNVKEIWKLSAGRCDVLTGLVQVGNFELIGQITAHFNNYAQIVP